MKGEGYMIEEILEVLEKFVSDDRYIKMAQYLHTIEEDAEFLGYLEDNGVDNWIGYSDAYNKMMRDHEEGEENEY
jgi:uncharacterized protein YihD (DUF1040 family)